MKFLFNKIDEGTAYFTKQPARGYIVGFRLFGKNIFFACNHAWTIKVFNNIYDPYDWIVE